MIQEIIYNYVIFQCQEAIKEVKNGKKIENLAKETLVVLLHLIHRIFWKLKGGAMQHLLSNFPKNYKKYVFKEKGVSRTRFKGLYMATTS